MEYLVKLMSFRLPLLFRSGFYFSSENVKTTLFMMLKQANKISVDKIFRPYTYLLPKKSFVFRKNHMTRNKHKQKQKKICTSRIIKASGKLKSKTWREN